MKKLISSYFGVVLSLSAIQAQDLQVVEEDKVPQSVVDSFNKDFPDVKTTGWQILPESELEEHEDYLTELAFGEYEPPSEEPYNFYTVYFDGKGMSGSVTYNEAGKMVTSRETIKNTALPSAVGKSIVNQYPGWKIVGDREVIKNLEYKVYKVKIEKGKERKWLYLDEKGNAVGKQDIN